MKTLGTVLILVMAFLTLVSVKTAIPDSGGEKNLLGYDTYYPFAPASTTIGLAIVVVLFFLAKKMTLF